MIGMQLYNEQGDMKHERNTSVASCLSVPTFNIKKANILEQHYHKRAISVWEDCKRKEFLCFCSDLEHGAMAGLRRHSLYTTLVQYTQGPLQVLFK
jgi:hypothetical protein